MGLFRVQRYDLLLEKMPKKLNKLCLFADVIYGVVQATKYSRSSRLHTRSDGEAQAGCPRIFGQKKQLLVQCSTSTLLLQLTKKGWKLNHSYFRLQIITPESLMRWWKGQEVAMIHLSGPIVAYTKGSLEEKKCPLVIS